MVLDVARDWRQADLEAGDRALCAYSEKLTRNPEEMNEADVQALRAAGFDDRAILDACNVVGYFNFVTRIAHGLGVDVEDFWPEEEIL